MTDKTDTTALVIADELNEWARDYAPTDLAKALATCGAALLKNQHARIAEMESGHNYNILVIDVYRVQANALEAQLSTIGTVAACFGDDWPDIPGEPEVLRRVKWAARQLKAVPEYAQLTDERIREIDDETHFHESPSWPLRFARAIEAAHDIK